MRTLSETGILVPDSDICEAATEYARHQLEAPLFNHVMRTYAFAAMAGKRGSQNWDPELLHVGCVLHDMGLSDHVPVGERFELDGADASKSFLIERGMPDHRVDVVWDAIALHTTYMVPQRKRPEVALVQLGAAVDVGVAPLEIAGSSYDIDAILQTWPRLGFKSALQDALLRRFNRNPRAAGSHVVADVAERHAHGFIRPNICDAINEADFPE